MTRRPSSVASVQWLRAGPLSASTSSPSGRAKLSLKRPTRVMDTPRSAASTSRSSPSESTCRVVTRTSGATGAILSSTCPPSSPWRNTFWSTTSGCPCAERGSSDWSKSPAFTAERPAARTPSGWASPPKPRAIMPPALSAPMTRGARSVSSTGSAAVARCSSRSKRNATACAGAIATCSRRLAGSNRHSPTGPLPTSPTVKPSGTSRSSAATRPCFGRMVTRARPFTTPGPGR